MKAYCKFKNMNFKSSGFWKLKTFTHDTVMYVLHAKYGSVINDHSAPFCRFFSCYQVSLTQTHTLFICHHLVSGPEIIKLVPCSTQLSTKLILLINVKMPTIVGILTFISMMNTTYQSLKARNFFIVGISVFMSS